MRLKTRLTSAFLALAIIPLAISGSVLVKIVYDTTYDTQLALQSQDAQMAAGRVAGQMDGLFRELAQLVRLNGLTRSDKSQQEQLIIDMVSWEPQIAELAWLDGDGRERVRVSRHHVHGRSDLSSRANALEFSEPASTQAVWVGPIEVEPETSEPLMTVSLPIISNRQSRVEGILVARLRLKKMWDTMGDLLPKGADDVYIVDESGLVVAHRNPSVVLRGTRVRLPAEDGRHIGLDGRSVLSARVNFLAAGKPLTAISERDLEQALALPQKAAWVTGLIMAAALLAALGLVWISRRSLIRPIERLAEVATEISAGNLDRRAEENQRGDELGDLAHAFNVMTSQLQSSVTALEANVADRTRDLSAMRTRLAEAIDSISEGFMLCDADDRVILFNRKIKDFYPEIAHLITPGRSFTDLAWAVAKLGLEAETGTDSEAWVRRRMALRAAQMPHIQRLTSGRWLLVNERRTSTGQTVAIYTDITELKESEEALRHAKAQAESATMAKSAFLAAMSHELRTPLNAIIGFSDTILSEVFGKLPHERYLGYIVDIHTSGQHLLALINDILDLSKIEAGKMTIEEKPVDCTQMATRAVEMIRDAASAHHLTLSASIPASLPIIRGDERRLLQVMLNLLSNAVKFTPEGGSIQVNAACAADGRSVILSVADSGIGIAEADIPRALEAFGQVESTHSRRYPGTGLGLPLARQLVELHGGRLDLSSQLGLGTTVTVILPAQAGISTVSP